MNNIEMARAYIKEAIRRIKTAESAFKEEGYAYH